MYGLGFDEDEDEDDLTEMNPKKMKLAYVTRWEKTAIATSSARELWGGCAVLEPVVAAAIDKEEDRGKQTNLWTDEPPPDPTAGQLMCPSHGKLYNKGICSGVSRLVREERKKREVEREEVVVYPPNDSLSSSSYTIP